MPPSGPTATAMPSPPSPQTFCQTSVPSAANLTTKRLFAAAVKLSVVPTTYALPSAATATPFAPSLLAPPQVVCESKVGPEGDPIATPGRSNARLASIIPRILDRFPIVSKTHISTSLPGPVAQPEKPTLMNKASSVTMVLVSPSRRNGQRRRLRNTPL